MQSISVFPARLSSQPDETRRSAWDDGAFTTAYRPATDCVEGEIHSSSHLIMATLKGGARRHEFRTDCGVRYDGPDRPGTISFLPAGCMRTLRLHRVEWRWASIAFQPDLENASVLGSLGPFSASEDMFVLGVLSEFERLDALDGGLDPIWRSCMIDALLAYISKRYAAVLRVATGPTALASWQIRRVNDLIDAQMSGELRIRDLAATCGLSEGHFHRAFRATLGVTPLQHVNARRVEAAKQLLAGTTLSVGVIAFKVGFISASHFARVFRQATGVSPGDYRRTFRVRSAPPGIRSR
ncbi:MAG: helix-turn-helix transcriptional regulator [Tabrizicola sp.]|nr:helix-turn-helix transcriptional regulator [Tabrizicola sp.]